MALTVLEIVLYWGLAAVSAGMAGGLQFFTFSSDYYKKRKVFIASVILIMHAAVLGSLALGQGIETRDDGHKVTWGRTALYAATHGLVLGLVTLALSEKIYDIKAEPHKVHVEIRSIVATVLGTASSLPLLFGSLSTGHGIWFWYIWAGVGWALSAAFLFLNVYHPGQLLSSTPSGGSQSRPPNPEGLKDLKQGVAGQWIWLITKGAVSFVLASYLIIFPFEASWTNLLESQFATLCYFGLDLVKLSVVAGVVLFVNVDHSSGIFTGLPTLTAVVEKAQDVVNGNFPGVSLHLVGNSMPGYQPVRTSGFGANGLPVGV